jgi:hypothetical protein
MVKDLRLYFLVKSDFQAKYPRPPPHFFITYLVSVIKELTMNQNARTKIYGILVFNLKIPKVFITIRTGKIISLIGIVIYLLAFYFSCEKNKTPTGIILPKPEIKLSLAQEPRLSEIYLKLELSNIKLPQNFQLSRNDSIILNGQITTNDSVFKDTGLIPATEYRYKAFLLQNGVIIDTSSLLQVRTMDTTSHNYMWTIDTIGGIGSGLLDVFAVSEDDVWAVGDIDTGVYPPFNAMHWNGHQWELKRVRKTDNNIISSIRSIWHFSNINIWLAAGSIYHWTGGLAQLSYQRDINTSETVEKLWAGSLSDIYGVGNEGIIVHYNNNTWQRMNSGTQLQLTDICGFSDATIFIVGSSSSTLDNVFLVFKNNQLHQRIDDAIWRKKSVWGIASDRLYVAGSGLFFYDGTNLNSLPWPSNLPFIHIENLRGSEENNIFMVGHFGFVAHYNGSTWHYFGEISRDITLQSVAVLENEVFAVGYDSFFGYLYHGRRID